MLWWQRQELGGTIIVIGVAVETLNHTYIRCFGGSVIDETYQHWTEPFKLYHLSGL